jgi:hypothetical protein
VIAVEYMRGERLAAAAAQQTAAATPGAPAAPAAPRDLPQWQTVLYFETALSNGSGRIRAAQEMMKHVDSLVQMGTVDVVFANPTPVALVRNSRDTGAIRAALEKVSANVSVNQLAAHRREFFRELGQMGSLQALKSQSKQEPIKLEYAHKGSANQTTQARQEFDGTSAPQFSTVNANTIRPYIEQEIALISRFREQLTTWVSSYSRHVPRNLLLVSDGFDVDPLEYYTSVAPGAAQVDLRTYVAHSRLGETAQRLSKVLASGAWTTSSFPSDNNADGWADDSTVSGVGRIHGTMAKKPNSSPKAFLIRPHDPLLLIAEDTGGKVVANSSQIGNAIEALDDRVKLTYQVDRKSDGKLRTLQVRARDAALKVRAPKFAASSTPDEIAEVRAIGLLRAANYEGELPTEATMEWGTPAGTKINGMLRVVVQAGLAKRLLADGAKGKFRMTLAVQLGKEAVVGKRAVHDYDLIDGVFRMRTPLDLPATATGLIIVIEETTTGLWGSTRVNMPSATPAG